MTAYLFTLTIIGVFLGGVIVGFVLGWKSLDSFND